MTRVLHTGDTHLGYRQYNSPTRREDFAAAFRQVVEDAVEGEFDAVVHAGDLFHDRRPALDDLLDTVDALRDLRAADVPFLAVVGNHERKRSAQWLDLFADIGVATRLDATGTVVGDTTFYGLDYVPASRRAALAYDFEPSETDHAALVAHGLFEPFAHADWDTEAVLDAATVDFDAMLLGDNHVPGQEKVAGTWVTYPGSTERVSADERDERGYNIVEFAGGEATISRRAIDVTREFVFVDVELAAGEGEQRVRERVAEHDLTDAVVVVSVEGEGEAVTPAAVETFAEEEGALLARVRDRREVESADETDVSFADPDDAVRERVREMGLSVAARDVDDLVRSPADVAKTTVRGRVEERVRDRLADGLAAFEPAEGAAPPADADDEADDRETADDDSADDTDDGELGDSADGATDGADDPTDSPDAGDSTDAAADEAADGTDDADIADETADQASMEEYL